MNEAIVRNAYQVAERKDLDAANLRTQNGYVIDKGNARRLSYGISRLIFR